MMESGTCIKKKKQLTSPKHSTQT